MAYLHNSNMSEYYSPLFPNPISCFVDIAKEFSSEVVNRYVNKLYKLTFKIQSICICWLTNKIISATDTDLNFVFNTFTTILSVSLFSLENLKPDWCLNTEEFSEAVDWLYNTRRFKTTLSMQRAYHCHRSHGRLKSLIQIDRVN